MRRSYNRRSPEQRVSELEERIALLKAKQAVRDKKSDPVVREMQKLQKRLKRFVQLAHDHKRPDVANSAMAFRSMLERMLGAEIGSDGKDEEGPDDE